MENHHQYVITAAGGNATAIQILKAAAASAEAYAQLGKQQMAKMEQHGAEQAGFLIPSIKHFEMAGGEFCGNAARAAAYLLFKLTGNRQVSFTMSSCPNQVEGQVKELGDGKSDVTCTFVDLPTKGKPVVANGGQPAMLVDLGGIVHVVIDAPFPKDRYEHIHRAITQELHLGDREAVGVIWVSDTDKGKRIDPVVWVKGIDSFFYESACGSGSIAAASTTGAKTIIQPTGQPIDVNIAGNTTILHSAMEVVYVD